MNPSPVSVASRPRAGHAAALLAVLLFFCGQAAALACEGCKSSMSAGTAAEDSGLGFAASTYIMLALPLLLVGGIGCMAYRNIRKIDQIRQAEAELTLATE